MPDGRIVYSDGSGNSNVYMYDPVSTTNTLIFSGNFTVDDIETNITGHIALAGQSNNSIVVLNSAGSVVNTFGTPHYPDGLAFGAGTAANSIFANNNDGTITKYDLAAGFLAATQSTDIFSGSGYATLWLRSAPTVFMSRNSTTTAITDRSMGWGRTGMTTPPVLRPRSFASRRWVRTARQSASSIHQLKITFPSRQRDAVDSSNADVGSPGAPPPRRLIR